MKSLLTKLSKRKLFVAESLWKCRKKLIRQQTLSRRDDSKYNDFHTDPEKHVPSKIYKKMSTNEVDAIHDFLWEVVDGTTKFTKTNLLKALFRYSLEK